MTAVVRAEGCPTTIPAATSASGSQTPSGIVTEGLAAIGGGVLDANNVFYNPVQFRLQGELAVEWKLVEKGNQEISSVVGCSYCTARLGLKDHPTLRFKRPCRLRRLHGTIHQVFNRDLSILAIRVFAAMRNEDHQKKRGKLDETDADVTAVNNPKLYILEPLAATGLRSIRYALELNDVVEMVVAGDLDPNAVRTMESNRSRNHVPPNVLRAVCCDANQLMHACHFGGVQASAHFCLPAVESSSSLPVGIDSAKSAELPPFAMPLPTTSIPTLFDVIDLDPYGSVASFLDAAVLAVADGGMLCMTSTDMPILCGNNPEVSFYKYGGNASKARYMHEMSLRLLMNGLAMAAARHKRVIIPLLCASIDFYVRCFVRIQTSAAGCKLLASKTALAFQCTACDSFIVTPLGISESRNEGSGVTTTPDCTESKGVEVSHTGEKKTQTSRATRTKFKVPQVPKIDMTKCRQCNNDSIWIAGPFYAGPLYNREFLNRCLKMLLPSAEETYPFVKSLSMRPKMRGLLTAMSEELHNVPLFYLLPSLMNRVKTETMKLSQFKSALLHLGYKVSHFHREPQSIKTDAPDEIIFDIIRKWAQVHPPKNPEKYAILQKPFTIDETKINFELHPDAVNKSLDVSKWLPNPTPYWGPKARAKSTGPRTEDSERKKQRID